MPPAYPAQLAGPEPDHHQGEQLLGSGARMRLWSPGIDVRTKTMCTSAGYRRARL